MKKDQHQTSSAPTTINEPKTSSTALTLQQLNKETEKNEAAAEAMRTRCKVCFREIAPKRMCGGHGGGGSGGSGDGDSASTSEEKASKNDDTSMLKKSDHADEEELIGEFSSMGDSEELDSESQSDETSFDPKIIAELVANGLLVINNDRESKTLTINLQCDPDSLSKEQRIELKKFMKAILKELNEFKEENHISVECMKITQDRKGNILSLCITLPTLALYDAFIKRLANNLLPTPNPELQEKDETQKAQGFAPKPLSTEPKPSTSIQDKVECDESPAPKETEDEQQEIFNPSPFEPKMKPW